MKHLLSTADLTRQQAVNVLDTAKQLTAATSQGLGKLPPLRGRTVVNLFYEDSTRTRISFEAAAKRLSADVINFSAKGSSVSKGESLKDTALTLEAMGADAVVIRHQSSGAPHRLAHAGWISGAVVNAGDGTHEHPTQALLDAYTMRQNLRDGEGDLDGVQVTIVGDVLHSRVARSNVILLQTTHEYSNRYGLNVARMNRMPANSIVMHPGPMNRGMEISADVADSKRSVIVQQVANGVSVRMAVLYLMLGGTEVGE